MCYGICSAANATAAAHSPCNLSFLHSEYGILWSAARPAVYHNDAVRNRKHEKYYSLQKLKYQKDVYLLESNIRHCHSVYM